MAQAELAEFIILPTTPEPNEPDSYKWNHNNTLLFLDLYKSYRKEVGTLKIRNLKKMYEEIAKEMKTKTGHNISAANCENRWKHLERSYKKYIDNNNKTGRGRRDFEYADVMNEILGKKKNINPEILLSTETVENPLNKNESRRERQETIEEERTSIPIVEETGRKLEIATKSKETYSNRKTKVDILKLMREDRKEYYKRRLEQEDRRIELLEKYLKKENNDLQIVDL